MRLSKLALLGLAAALSGMAACAQPESEAPEAPTENTAEEGAAVEQRAGVVEVVTFRLNPGVTEEQFLAENQRIQEEFVARQPGYISRETARGENGEWLVLVKWRSLEDSQASMSGFGASPVTQQFMGMLDASSMVGKVYRDPV